MFDDVFDDKQWKTAREKAGLKGGLTEKVSMGDEFKRFQKDKTVAAAKVLKEKIALYEKQLKDKHSKEKYYASLLKVVQGQKAAIEAGIEAAERPVDKDGKVMTDKDMDDLVNDVVEKQKEHDREWEDPNKDPNAPAMGEARLVYLKLTKGFKALEERFKSDRAALTEVLQKCKTLETHPQLKTRPEVALGVAEKMVETVTKIETKSFGLLTDFGNEAEKVRNKEGRTSKAAKELDRLMALLKVEYDQIADTSHACRLTLKKTLQSIGGQPKAQEMLGRLGV